MKQREKYEKALAELPREQLESLAASFWVLSKYLLEREKQRMLQKKMLRYEQKITALENSVPYSKRLRGQDSDPKPAEDPWPSLDPLFES